MADSKVALIAVRELAVIGGFGSAGRGIARSRPEADEV